MKTIFVTLPNITVFRNLFSFPNSFFHRLAELQKRGEPTRVVYLVHARDYEKFSWFFKAYLNERCFLEGVTVEPKKTFFRKTFRFCYAYLVYTGTTKVLTTMGMRAEDPPAAANRYLSFFRIILSGTLGKISFVKRTLVPALHLAIFSERPFRSIFDRYKPSAVLATNIYGEFDTFFLAEAKRQGVRMIAMPANWDHIDKYFLPIQADLLLVPNEQVKEAAVKYQAYRNEEVQPVGYPYLDFINHPDCVLSRDAVLGYLGFPKEARYLLYISGSAYCPDEPDVIEEIISWIDQGLFGKDMYLVLRPYLGGRSKDKEFDRKKYENFERHPRVRFYTEKAWEKLEDGIRYLNVMRHAAVVMTVYSTAFLEAAVMDRPLVAAVFDGHKKRPYHRSIKRFEEFEHFRDFIAFGAIKRAFNFDELESALKAYLHNPSLDAEKRAQVRDVVCYKLDDRSSERVLHAVLKAANDSPTCA